MQRRHACSRPRCSLQESKLRKDCLFGCSMQTNCYGYGWDGLLRCCYCCCSKWSTKTWKTTLTTNATRSAFSLAYFHCCSLVILWLTSDCSNCHLFEIDSSRRLMWSYFHLFADLDRIRLDSCRWCVFSNLELGSCVWAFSCCSRLLVALWTENVDETRTTTRS